jgi:tryptophan synthase alpha chain
MNRLKAAFQNRTKSLLMTFTVAGDPDYATSLEIIRALVNGGADIIELGLPFSDPVADGPVIQQADQRALASGMNTNRFFDLVRDIRKESEIPLVVLTTPT